ncbi:von Willebrand factor-like [Saccoglossus kowalevskii]|uniref:Uncharacterized protein LOC102803722 n=1 Tax=Saccoglossus kowalevskii TaxID=10224 RepID=A0ABM0M674_SACKO|nr:PREDICTED: uncharacterized protein LOC102803722 [Saccoglossus kowalevskii]
MWFRCCFVLLVFALMICMATVPVKTAPSTEIAENGAHHVAKRTGDTYNCKIEWIECTKIRIAIQIIIYITSANDEPLTHDLVTPYTIDDESDNTVLWSGDMVLPAGEMSASTPIIDLTSTISTVFGLDFIDPFLHKAIHEILGKCGHGTGDPHMMTFDGRKFTFNGHCSYVLSEECGNIDPSFQVTADFRGKNPNTPYEPPTRMVAFNITNYGKQLVRINEDNSVLIKGKALTTHSGRIGDNEGFVSRSGSNVTIYLTQPSVSLNWNRAIHGITIGLDDADLFGNVCGLLGNADGDPHNDFVMPDGFRTSDVDMFGNSWEVKGSCP